MLPDNPEAKQMLADFKRTEAQQRARQEEGRMEALKRSFDSFIAKIAGATLVETHELKSLKPAKQLAALIADKLRSGTPGFRVSHLDWPEDAIFHMDGDQQVSGGGRLCLIVGGQTKAEEARVLFKVVEFKSESLGSKILGAFLGPVVAPGNQPSFQPINPSNPQLSSDDKNRIAEGVRLLTERIQLAVDEAPAQ